MKRGVTLLELLLALSLLSVLVAGIATWVNLSGHLAVIARDNLTWQQSANAALRLIHDELVTYDQSLQESDQAETSRISVHGGELHVTTRTVEPSGQEERGERVVSYHLNTDESWLIRRIDGRIREQRLLGHVATFDAMLVEVEEGLQPTWLHLTIGSHAGHIVERRFRLP